MNWDWGFAQESFGPIIHAFFKYTLGLTAASAVIAIVLGLVFAIGRRSRSKLVSRSTYFVVEFIRSTPIPVQLLLVYFGGPQLGIVLGAFASSVIVFGVHYAAYMSEVYRAGIDAIPSGQWEACTALSLSATRTWRDVVLPQVVRRIVPSIGNQIIALFKETPFAIVVGLQEMVSVANAIGADKFKFLEVFTIAGLIFLAASYPTSVAMRKLEVRLGHV